MPAYRAEAAAVGEDNAITSLMAKSAQTNVAAEGAIERFFWGTKRVQQLTRVAAQKTRSTFRGRNP
jgi:hypothetical protein